MLCGTSESNSTLFGVFFRASEFTYNLVVTLVSSMYGSIDWLSICWGTGINTGFFSGGGGGVRGCLMQQQKMMPAMLDQTSSFFYFHFFAPLLFHNFFFLFSPFFYMSC